MDGPPKFATEPTIYKRRWTFRSHGHFNNGASRTRAVNTDRGTDEIVSWSKKRKTNFSFVENSLKSIGFPISFRNRLTKNTFTYTHTCTIVEENFVWKFYSIGN